MLRISAGPPPPPILLLLMVITLPFCELTDLFLLVCFQSAVVYATIVNQFLFSLLFLAVHIFCHGSTFISLMKYVNITLIRNKWSV